jgi:hypothetical protein
MKQTIIETAAIWRLAAHGRHCWRVRLGLLLWVAGFRKRAQRLIH